MKVVLLKLYKFLGKGVRHVVERADEAHCFRLHRQRVFYVRESLMRRATNVSVGRRAAAYVRRPWDTPFSPSPLGPDFPVARCFTQVARDKLVGLGTMIGKFTHSDKFQLTVGALDILSAHAKHKVLLIPDSPFILIFFLPPPGFLFGTTCARCGPREGARAAGGGLAVPLFFLHLIPPFRRCG